MNRNNIIFLTKLGFAFILGHSTIGHADPAVTDMTLVSEKRISRTVFEYSYRASIENQGPEITNIVGRITGTGQGTTIVDDLVQVEKIGINASVVSSDTFTLKHDRRFPFDKSALTWSMSWKTAPQPETTLDLFSAPVGPQGGSVVLPGFAEITLTEDPLREPVTVELKKIVSPDMSIAFAEDRSDAGPVTPEILHIHSTGNINTPVAVCIFVPSEFSSSVPSDYHIELFAEFVQTSEQDANISFEQLGASFDPQTGKACASLPPYAFKPVASVVSHVIVGSYPNVTANSQATPTNFAPTGEYTTTPNSTIPVSGDITFIVPPVLKPPLAGALNVTSSFGPRTHPVTGEQQSFHLGVDFASNGANVLAAAKGNVTNAGAQVPCNTWENGVCKTGYGHRVYISHTGSTGSSGTLYAHLEPAGMAALGNVESQSTVGVSDHSGTSTGPHLHFEYRQGGVAVNPMLFIGEVIADEYLQSLSVVAKIDGNPIESSRRQVTAESFHYNTNIDLTPLALTPGNHSLSVHVENQSGVGTLIHSATLKLSQFPLRVKVTWDKFDTDVDLHVLDSVGNESWYRNLCGVPNGCLDHDDVDGFGPEIFDLNAIAPGVKYTLYLHYFSDHGNGPTTANVTVEVGQQTYGPFSKILTDGENWTIGKFPQ